MWHLKRQWNKNKSDPDTKCTLSRALLKYKWNGAEGGKYFSARCANRWQYGMGMNITGHFTSSPFSLFYLLPSLPPSHNLSHSSASSSSPPLLPAPSISLSSVKVMQLIFLCLFIFQDWLWNVGSRQKPRRLRPSIALLSCTFPSPSPPPQAPPPRPQFPCVPSEWWGKTHPPPPPTPPPLNSPDLDPPPHHSFPILPSPPPPLTFVCRRRPPPPHPRLRPRPLANAFQPHIPLTELKSCITLKKPCQCIVGGRCWNWYPN